MKGLLEKTTRGWVVKVLAAEGPDARFVRTYPLHETDASHFDEAVRLGTHGEVEFELVKEWIDKHTNQVQVYAKLVLPMLDRLRAHLNSITPEQFEKEIDDIIKTDTSVQVLWECCGMEDCICEPEDDGLTDDEWVIKELKKERDAMLKEISDEEIEQAGIEWHNSAMLRSRISFVAGAKWYREQLKNQTK